MNLLLKSRHSNLSRPIPNQFPFSNSCPTNYVPLTVTILQLNLLWNLQGMNLFMIYIPPFCFCVFKSALWQKEGWENLPNGEIQKKFVWIRDRVLFPCDMTLLSFESKCSVISKHLCVNVTGSYLILSKHNYVTVGSWIWYQQMSPALISKSICSGSKSLKGSWNTMRLERNGVSQEISAAFVTVVM